MGFFRLKLIGKVALVTGANSGIGKAIAFYLAEEGADVVIDYVVNPDEANEVADQIKAMGRKSITIKADVSNASEVKSMFTKIIEEFSKLDILVNNAGIGNLIPTVDLSDEAWNKMIAIHLYGTMNCTREALKIMMK